ncbi:hypothetical protein [Brevundimonas sp. SL130]|uniref:hypothetical protein n=1 Tax=Brevundimonas sp. SL130 TaxID=2995143 RepID=UPI00226D3CAA|nr:hypothetical protein [Brevundimonas sp. SL130]WAC60147.1 hypothetical protein OU998_01500 [Brevundimonas sp. SL130]
MKRTALTVLGMHRSGTSSVAGALALLGATAPKTMFDPSPDNPKGYWESRAAVHLNDRMLGIGGSWWNDWRPLEPTRYSETQTGDFRSEIISLLQSEYGQAETIVLKDPRLCRLWPIWEPAVIESGFEPGYVLPLRPPAEVARSLLMRDGFSMEEGLLLWLQHVLSAERYSRGRPRVVLRWSDFIQDWSSQVARIAQSLDWIHDPSPAAAAAVDDFLAPDPRTRRSTLSEARQPSQIHDWANQAYGLMTALMLEDTAATHHRIDDLARLFDSACGLFGAALAPALVKAQTAQTYQMERDQALHEASVARDRIATLASESTERADQLRIALQSVQTLESQKSELEVHARRDAVVIRRMAASIDRLTDAVARADAQTDAVVESRAQAESVIQAMTLVRTQVEALEQSHARAQALASEQSAGQLQTLTETLERTFDQVQRQARVGAEEAQARIVFEVAARQEQARISDQALTEQRREAVIKAERQAEALYQTQAALDAARADRNCLEDQIRRHPLATWRRLRAASQTAD